MKISLYGFVAILVGVCSVPAMTVFAAEQRAVEALNPVAPPAPVVIPVAEVAARATEVTNLLRSYDAKFTPGGEIETIAKALSVFSPLLDLEIAASTNILEERPGLELLQTQQQLWQRRQFQTTAWLNVLTARATALQDAQSQLAGLSKIWTDTREAAQDANAPDPILRQIDATRASLEAAQVPLQKERIAVLDLQSQVASKVAACNELLAQIAQSQQRAVAGILVRDGLPIWSTELWIDGPVRWPEIAPKVAARYRSDILRYLRDPAEGAHWHTTLFVLLAGAFWLVKWRLGRLERTGETPSPALMVLHRPWAASFLLVLFSVSSPFSQIPTAVRQIFQILTLAPAILLTLPVLHVRLLPVVYALAVLFTIDLLRQPFAGVPLIGQAILILESIAGLVVAAGLLRSLKPVSVEEAGAIRLPAVRLVMGLFIVSFAIGLVAAGLGYVRLGGLLVSGILAAGALALALYATVRLMSGLVAFFLRVWPLRLLRTVLYNRELLERRVYGLFLLLAVLGWLVRYLDYVGLFEPASAVVKTVFQAKLERGSISISVEDVLVFLFTIWVACLLSRFIRFVLQEDIYPRLHLAPGQSYAASSLLNYVIVALGFLAALGALGVDFSKVSILAGAFGVGIGFGLQSVVNNFVSGLILLFERPIRVGDVVQVSNIQGRVTRIGMRASIVHTFEGAEIIVPNAQLITQEVTNWTRSDQLRRLEIPVAISYGATPQKVIELLENVGRAHPKVLRHPAPQALFMGYGDSSINFELRAWAEFADWAQVRSDLTAAVYDGVYAAGMSFPFPQREVRVLSDGGQVMPGRRVSREGQS